MFIGGLTTMAGMFAINCETVMKHQRRKNWKAFGAGKVMALSGYLLTLVIAVTALLGN
jgi:hypothetical protein